MFRPWKIPTLVVKPWRLVEELDTFEDAECSRMFDQLMPVRIRALAVAFVVAALFGGALTAACLWGIELMSNRMPRFDGDTLLGRLSWLLAVGALIAATTTVAFQPYASILGKEIKRRISRVSCVACGYSLLGLPVADGMVVCPECGDRIVLAEHGLRVEDIMSGERRRSSSPSSTRGGWRPLIAFIPGAALLAAWIVYGSELLFAIAGVAIMFSACILHARHSMPRY